MKPKIFIYRILVWGAMMTLFTGCKKFLEIPPPKTTLVGSSVFESEAAAISAQAQVFYNMGFNGNNFSNYNEFPNLSADEWLTYNNGVDYVQLTKNTLTADNSRIKTIWQTSYYSIYLANAVIEGLASSTSISGPVKKELTGEAKFCRAFLYFYLVNYFGDVPLITTTAYQDNATMARTPKNKVYDQIILDLMDAQANLNDNYLSGDLKMVSTDRVRPTKSTATSLLARVYLYKENWANAEAEASKVIADSKYKLESSLDNVFLTSSQEAIWQLPSFNANLNSWSGATYVAVSVVAPSASGLAVLNPTFLNTFESGDLRSQKWINSQVYGTTRYYYPFKYKVRRSTTVTELETIFRLAELYLIRAEARAQLGASRIPDAVSDVNAIRRRSRASTTTSEPNPLPDLPSTISKDDLLKAILHERQVELFAEFGHRWLDLKRTGKINDVMQAIAPQKQMTWDPRQALYPIPSSEILLNSNLLPNNPGY